jgi:hypothetical protein
VRGLHGVDDLVAGLPRLADPTGSVVHVTRTVGEVTTALPYIIVGSGTWPWFYDYPTVEGLYHYVFSFDGDAVHAPSRPARMSRSSAERCRSV